MKKRLAIVVQRWHESIAGGSERHAWHYANLLKDKYDVEIWSTCTLESKTWKNSLEPGAEKILDNDSIVVRRFPVSTGRTENWHRLHDLLVEYRTVLQREKTQERDTFLPWPFALQEEWIETQGPRSEMLEAYIAENHESFQAILFFTYLYPTTYFGSLRSNPERSILVPTLHDEDAAYLSVFRQMADRFRLILWNTEPEKTLGEQLWGPRRGAYGAVAIDPSANLILQSEGSAKRETGDEQGPFLLYCGRIDPGKGCQTLLDHFIKLKERSESDSLKGLRLILTGSLQMDLPDRSDIVFEGFVSDERKRELMAGALCFIMPSLNESLSIVTLEAMSEGTPIVADIRNPVLEWHLSRSGGGSGFQDFQTFRESIEHLSRDPIFSAKLGAAGRKYVNENYGSDALRERLIGAIEGEDL